MTNQQKIDSNRAIAAGAVACIDPLIPWRQALPLMGLSPSTGERRRKSDPTFPPRVAIGPKRWALRASAIRRWNETRPTDREITFEPPRKKSPSERIESLEPKVSTGTDCVQGDVEGQHFIQLNTCVADQVDSARAGPIATRPPRGAIASEVERLR